MKKLVYLFSLVAVAILCLSLNSCAFKTQVKKTSASQELSANTQKKQSKTKPSKKSNIVKKQKEVKQEEEILVVTKASEEKSVEEIELKEEVVTKKGEKQATKSGNEQVIDTTELADILIDEPFEQVIDTSELYTNLVRVK